MSEESPADPPAAGAPDALHRKGEPMFTIRVVHESSGRPVRNAKVCCCMSGFFSGGFTSNEWSDGDGDATFETAPGRGTVYVNGSEAYSGYLSGRVVVYV